MSAPAPISFRETEYRCVNRDTRKLSEMVTSKMSLSHQQLATLLFLIESVSYRASFGGIQYQIMSSPFDFTDLCMKIHQLHSHPISRNDSTDFNLLAYPQAWDLLTATYHINDYSRDDMIKQSQILISFSEFTIAKAIERCDGHNFLSYFIRVLENIRSETILPKRKEELYQKMVRDSTVVTLPTFRYPGYIAQAMEEEMFFHAIQ